MTQLLNGQKQAVAGSDARFRFGPKPDNIRTLVWLGEFTVGGSYPVVIAGPCAVEDQESFLRIAAACKAAGANALRGGAFKPRTSPYSFQGLGKEGLKILARAREQLGMPVCSEVLDTRDVELVARYVDVLQIGVRNMHNYALLTEAGRSGLPVLLKRDFGATVQEWCLAAEYILSTGNDKVILCERGIRTFEPSTRYTLDIAAVPLILQESHMPVIVDPSHAAGKRSLVAALGRAGIAAGAHGLIVEVHDNPAVADCDGAQALLPNDLQSLVASVSRIAEACKTTDD
jgi:3-deoxy-7-phosphoheptulonate synthase